MFMGTCQAYLVFFEKRVKENLHFKAPVLAQGDGSVVRQSLSDFKNSGARRLSLGIGHARHHHRRKAVLIRVGVGVPDGYILLDVLYSSFGDGDSMGKMLDDVVLQRVLLAQMVGFQQL